MSPTTPLSRIERRTKIENTTSKIIYYVLPIIAFIFFVIASKHNSELINELHEFRANIGMKTLVIIMFIKPISLLGKKYLNTEIIGFSKAIAEIKYIIQNIKTKISRIITINNIFMLIANSIFSLSSYLMRFRRQLGVLCFRAVFIHFGLLEISRIKMKLPLFFNIKERIIITGMIGFIALLIGALTSNIRSIKFFKTKWKQIQMASYIAFIFAALHVGNVFIVIVFIFLKYQEGKENGNIFFTLINKTKSKLFSK